jgi:aarF domain-containing kinase
VVRELAQADGEVRYAAALRMVFERLGATYIKVGQFIASSPAFFDSELVHECGSLLDQTSPTPWPFIRATIMRELNISSLYDVFESVDPRPLASASVAQCTPQRLDPQERTL